MYYRYAVAIKGELREKIFRLKQVAIEKAQSITIQKREPTTVYRQRRYPDTGEIDLIPLVEYWWDGAFQWQKLED